MTLEAQRRWTILPMFQERLQRFRVFFAPLYGATF
jgi:hypothetical protein